MDNNLYFHEPSHFSKEEFQKADHLQDFIKYLDSIPRLFAPNINLIIRPRGFGLTLAIEAMEKMLTCDELEGEKKDDPTLQIEKSPVIRLSLKKVKAKTPYEYEEALIKILQGQMWQHHLKNLKQARTHPKLVLSDLIDELWLKYQKSVVVLIDNYDVPFINASTLPPSDQDEAIAVYLDMLNAIKKSGTKVRFVLLTGHVKFELASQIAEGLPQVIDLSYRPQIDTLFGFTLEEVKEHFALELKRFAPRQGITVSEMLKALNDCYGHFVFSDRKIPVLCPASVAACFENEGYLLTYMANGDFTFLKTAIKNNDDADLSWLTKDGQDALFYDHVHLAPNADELGVLLLQLGFVSIDKVTITTGENFINYRYRFAMTNEEMRRLLKILLGKADPRLSTVPINPQVLCDGADDYDYPEK